MQKCIHVFVLCILMFPWFVAFRPLMQVLPALVIDWNMGMESADKAIIQKTDTINVVRSSSQKSNQSQSCYQCQGHRQRGFGKTPLEAINPTKYIQPAVVHAA